MKSRIPLSFTIVIVLLWSLPGMCTDIYLPSMPTMAKYFNTTISNIQYTIFFYTIGFSVGALFFGPISDRIGRRPVILASMLLGAFSSFIAMISSSLEILFAARFLQGIAMVGLGSTMRAVTKDICPDKETMAKFGATLGIAIPIAAAISPVLGGYIEKYLNWRISFAFILAYIIAFLIYSIKKLPETNHDKLERPLSYLILDYKEVLFNGTFFRYNAITAFALCSMYAYITVSPYLLQVKMGLSPENFGYTNLLLSAMLIISSYINSKLIYHRGIDNMLKTGVTLIGVAGILFVIGGIINIHSIFVIIIPLLIMICGCGFIYPNASAGGLSLFNKSAGTAGAIYACIQMMGGSAGSGFISLMSRHYDAQICLGVLVILQALIGNLFAKQLIARNKSFV